MALNTAPRRQCRHPRDSPPETAARRRGCCVKGLLSGVFRTIWVCPRTSCRVIVIKRCCLPPDLRGWLPEDHLAWFVLAVVEEMDLYAFYRPYRHDGHGRPAHDPQMMVALLLCAYCKGQRSSRVIERECVEDVAYRVIAANQRPDHTTIARFRQRHEDAIAGLFGEVLALCAEAGLVGVVVIAVGGTKVHANASQHSNRDYEQIAREILEQAAEIDELEDEQFGQARGDELPAELATAQGRRGWLREAKRRLDEKRAVEAKPIPRSRPERLLQSKRRLEEDLAVECTANAAYEAYRARGVMKDGRRFGGPRSPTSHPRRRPGRSTSLIPTRAT